MIGYMETAGYSNVIIGEKIRQRFCTALIDATIDGRCIEKMKALNGKQKATVQIQVRIRYYNTEIYIVDYVQGNGVHTNEP